MRFVDKIKSFLGPRKKVNKKPGRDHSNDEVRPSIGEMVDEVCQWAMGGDPSELALFLKTPRDELVKFHHSLGRNIRNHFCLWKHEWVPDIIDGVDHAKDHPDQISMKVLEGVHDRLMLA